MIRFTELVDKYNYPPKLKGQISTYFSKIFGYVCDHYDGTSAFKRKTVKTFNTLAFLIITNEDFWDDWDDSNILDCLPNISDSTLKDCLKSSYLQVSTIKWDIEIVDDADLSTKITQTSDAGKLSVVDPNLDEYLKDDKLIKLGVDIIEEDLSDYNDDEVFTNTNLSSRLDDSYKSFEEPTPPEYLFLQGPKIPKVDCSKIYRQGLIDGRKYVVYISLPEIPRNQSEISLTTDVTQMTDSELLNLYPNRRLYTRLQPLYEHLDRVDYDSILGCILHVKGFTRKQMIDNIIKYPHLEGLVRQGRLRGTLRYVDFWKYIEINGELYKTKDIWEDLEDTKRLPKVKAVMEDYVVRRYLLERDLKGIEHKYKLFGELDPYLTLFMPSENYIQLGYTDVIDIAKQCVKSRVSYKLSRNPVIRRLDEHV